MWSLQKIIWVIAVCIFTVWCNKYLSTTSQCANGMKYRCMIDDDWHWWIFMMYVCCTVNDSIASLVSFAFSHPNPRALYRNESFLTWVSPSTSPCQWSMRPGITCVAHIARPGRPYILLMTNVGGWPPTTWFVAKILLQDRGHEPHRGRQQGTFWSQRNKTSACVKPETRIGTPVANYRTMKRIETFRFWTCICLASWKLV